MEDIIKPLILIAARNQPNVDVSEIKGFFKGR